MHLIFDIFLFSLIFFNLFNIFFLFYIYIIKRNYRSGINNHSSAKNCYPIKFFQCHQTFIPFHFSKICSGQCKVLIFCVFIPFKDIWDEENHQCQIQLGWYLCFYSVLLFLLPIHMMSFLDLCLSLYLLPLSNLWQFLSWLLPFHSILITSIWDEESLRICVQKHVGIRPTAPCSLFFLL